MARMVVGEPNEFRLIINSQISARQLISRFLSTRVCVPLLIYLAQLSTDKYPGCNHCVSKQLLMSPSAGKMANKDPSKADSSLQQASVFSCQQISSSATSLLLQGFRFFIYFYFFTSPSKNKAGMCTCIGRLEPVLDAVLLLFLSLLI